MDKQILALPDGLNDRGSVDVLQQRYCVQIGEPAQTDLVYLDTCDSRLFNKSYVLWHHGQQLWAQSARHEGQCFHAETSTVPVFRSDLPPGKLQHHIAPLLDVRALIPYSKLYLRQIPMRIFDAHDKTVLRLEFEQYGSTPDHTDTSQPSYLRLCPVQGYPEYVKAVRQWLMQQGAVAIQEPVAQDVLTALNLQPKAYSAKLNFDFTAMTPYLPWAI